MNLNILVIVLIVVVIYLIHTTSSKKEAFGINPIEDGYTNNNYWNPYTNNNYRDNYLDFYKEECNVVNTNDDCQNPYWKRICRDKCNLIQKKKLDKNEKNHELINN
jgi:hypothetical protein